MSPAREAVLKHAAAYITEHRNMSGGDEMAEKWLAAVEAEAAGPAFRRGVIYGGFAIALIALVLR